MIDKSKIAELGAVAYAAHKLADNATQAGGVAQIDILAITAPKPGAYRYTRPDTGEVLVVNPGERMYSTASMLATEMFNGKEWINLEDPV